MQGAELCMRLARMHWSLDDAGATAFTRMPPFAYSIASDLVAAARPPLVSDANTAGTPEIA